MEYLVENRKYCREIKNGKGMIFEKNLWDDYGYKTLFEVYFFQDSVPEKIGQIMIADISEAMKIEDKNCTRVVSYTTYDYLPKQFEELSENYVCLGTEEFYLSLKRFEAEGKLSIREVLKQLNDIAYDSELFDSVYDKIPRLVDSSFLRGTTSYNVKNKLHRLAHNKKERIPFNFVIDYKVNEEEFEMNFEVDLTSKLPTHVHSIIGNNGVGKTTLFKDIIQAFSHQNKYVKSLFSKGDDTIELSFSQNRDSNEAKLEKLLFISFSYFDNQEFFKTKDSEFKSNNINFFGINNFEICQDSVPAYEQDFENNIDVIQRTNEKRVMFLKEILSVRPIRIELFGSDYMNNEIDENETLEQLKNKYSDFSSGYKILLLGVSALAAYVEEKTLVLFDEPELYLHPPLISDYIRIISNIMHKKNALSIVATHSPIVVQETPKECTYIIKKTDTINNRVIRPAKETFGENISLLTDEVFGLDVKQAGFYKFLLDNYKDIYRNIDSLQLGNDAQLMLEILYHTMGNKEGGEKSV